MFCGGLGTFRLLERDLLEDAGIEDAPVPDASSRQTHGRTGKFLRAPAEHTTQPWSQAIRIDLDPPVIPQSPERVCGVGQSHRALAERAVGPHEPHVRLRRVAPTLQLLTLEQTQAQVAR